MAKKFLIVLFAVFTVICVPINTKAAGMNTGFKTTELSQEDKKEFLSNIGFSFISKEPQKSKIECFDVSNNGLVAVGFSRLDNIYISVYNESGSFCYGYVLEAHQSFGIEWDGNCLIIYFVRSDVAALLDSKGNILDIKRIEDTAENNFYWNNHVFSSQKNIGEYQYTLDKNMGILNLFMPTYARLIKTDSNGQKTIVYDAGKTQNVKSIIIFTLTVLFVAFAIFKVARLFNAKDRKRLD